MCWIFHGLRSEGYAAAYKGPEGAHCTKQRDTPACEIGSDPTSYVGDCHSRAPATQCRAVGDVHPKDLHEGTDTSSVLDVNQCRAGRGSHLPACRVIPVQVDPKWSPIDFSRAKNSVLMAGQAGVLSRGRRHVWGSDALYMCAMSHRGPHWRGTAFQQSEGRETRESSGVVRLTLWPGGVSTSGIHPGGTCPRLICLVRLPV